MKELNAEIDKLIHKTKGDLAVIKAIKAEKTVFPFSTVILSILLDTI